MKRKQRTSTGLLSNERGIALVMTLVLSAITLGITAGVLYMVTGGTQMSGTQKRYKTALEAGLGGTSVMFEVIRAGGSDPGLGLNNWYLNPSTCMTEKLDETTSTANWGSCNSDATHYDKATSLTIDTGEPDPPLTYDVRFDLGDPLDPPNVYTVYSKISDTVKGNTGGIQGLTISGVVDNTPGLVAVTKVPYLYTVEVQAERTTNTMERAKVAVLYQY
jgi:hypothetical protein